MLQLSAFFPSVHNSETGSIPQVLTPRGVLCYQNTMPEHTKVTANTKP